MINFCNSPRSEYLYNCKRVTQEDHDEEYALKIYY